MSLAMDSGGGLAIVIAAAIYNYKRAKRDIENLDYMQSINEAAAEIGPRIYSSDKGHDEKNIFIRKRLEDTIYEDMTDNMQERFSYLLRSKKIRERYHIDGLDFKSPNLISKRANWISLISGAGIGIIKTLYTDVKQGLGYGLGAGVLSKLGFEAGKYLAIRLHCREQKTI